MDLLVTIRKLGRSDVDEFIRIRLDGLRTNPTSFGTGIEIEKARPRSYFTDYLAPSRQRVVWGAFRDDRLVGVIRLDHEGRGTRRYIYSMYVMPPERGRGLARRLLRRAIRRAKKAAHVRQIYLTVEMTNEPALALYRSEGFRACGIEKDAYSVEGKFYSEYVMRKFVRSRRKGA